MVGQWIKIKITGCLLLPLTSAVKARRITSTYRKIDFQLFSFQKGLEVSA